MCGIVGLFIKNPELEKSLGALLAPMLIEMTDRGPDSAGVAIYGDSVAKGMVKMTVMTSEDNYDWKFLEKQLNEKFGNNVGIKTNTNHGILSVETDAETLNVWLKECHPELHKNSSGRNIEIYKAEGLPVNLIDQIQLENMSGTHALGHTRMATESAVTAEHSHPFSTGEDLCLVHNGSIHNYSSLRRELRAKGIEFQTDNDSEVAAGYLSWRLREGDSLDEALSSGLDALDGFYTFAIGSHDGFAILTDSIGCKPAVIAETDDWVAIASEYRAIACLPGVENAKVWEPEPAQIYSWHKA